MQFSKAEEKGTYHRDTDARRMHWERAVAARTKVLKPVHDRFYGDRSGFIQVSGEAALVLVNCGHDYIGISSVSTLKRLTLTPRKTPEKLLMVLVVPSERRTRRSAE